MHKSEMLRISIVLVVAAATAVAVCLAKPTGAPEEACDKLQPKHKEHKLQPADTFPYTVTASADTYASPTDTITVSLDSLDGATPFKGFLIAARDEVDKPFGSWTNSSMAHEISCSAVTHNNNDDKTSVIFTWMPPADATSGKISMTAAVVQNVSTFWAHIPVKMATASRRSGIDLSSATVKTGKASATAEKSKTTLSKAT